MFLQVCVCPQGGISASRGVSALRGGACSRGVSAPRWGAWSCLVSAPKGVGVVPGPGRGVVSQHAPRQTPPDQAPPQKRRLLLRTVSILLKCILVLNAKRNPVYYHLQRSCEGYVFTGICLSNGGGGGVGVSASEHAGIPHPPRSRHPPEQIPPRSRPPWSRQLPPPPEQTPPRADPPEQTPPRSRHPPEQTHTSPSRHTPPPGDTVTAADGTHPTGMHSCWISDSH